MPKQEQFQLWINQGYMPNRILEEYAWRNNMNYDDVQNIMRVVEYAVFLDREKRKGSS